MGVSLVVDVDQTAKSIERILEVNGADHLGTYTVDVTPYIPATQHQITIPTNYVVHHSEYPQTTFSITPNDTFKMSPRAVCDRGFDLILSKMKSGTVPDTMGKIEINGNEYRLQDFVVRVGTAVQVTTVKGVVMEVEFESFNVASQCKEALLEFMQTLFKGYTDKLPEQFQNTDKPENYTPLDTMWQYIQVVGKLRKKA